jgi:hypothetical protein
MRDFLNISVLSGSCNWFPCKLGKLPEYQHGGNGGYSCNGCGNQSDSHKYCNMMSCINKKCGYRGSWCPNIDSIIPANCSLFCPNWGRGLNYPMLDFLTISVLSGSCTWFPCEMGKWPEYLHSGSDGSNGCCNGNGVAIILIAAKMVKWLLAWYRQMWWK